MGRLQGKIALVTGSSRGIGRCIAERFADEGSDVIVHYQSNATAAEEVVAAVTAKGRRAKPYQADIALVAGMKALMDEVKKDFGGIDILVNNAGVFQMQPLAEVTEADFDRCFAVNVKGLFFATQAALPLVRDGGRIINLSSIVATMARMPNMSVYSATKAAVDCFTRLWALELGERGITVNAIGPGVIETDMAAGFHEDAEIRQQLIDDAPLQRIGQPVDIADVALFLASDESRWVTGQHINTSGGYHITG